MNQPPQTGRRIVSKGAYVVSGGSKVSGFSLGLFIQMVGLFIAVGSVLGFVCLLAPLLFPAFDTPMQDWKELVFPCFGLGIGAVVGIFLMCAGKEFVQSAKQIDAGVPITRANVADLPAPDSLVRASEEPMQKQGTVLLRAATQMQERHEEQLVRAAGETN